MSGPIDPQWEGSGNEGATPTPATGVLLVWTPSANFHAQRALAESVTLLGIQPLHAASLGLPDDNTKRFLSQTGFSSLYFPSVRSTAVYPDESYWADFVGTILERGLPRLSITACDELGARVLARLALRFRLPFFPGCTEISLASGDHFVLRRPAFAGRLLQEVSVDPRLPRILTLHAGRLMIRDRNGHRLCQPETLGSAQSHLEEWPLRFAAPKTGQIEPKQRSTYGPLLLSGPKTAGGPVWLHREIQEPSQRYKDALSFHLATGRPEHAFPPDAITAHLDARLNRCDHCASTTQRKSKRIGGEPIVVRHIALCPTCGWWSVVSESSLHHLGSLYTFHLARAVLKRFDLNAIEAPLEEIQQYLATRWEERFRLHPRRMEDLVGAVFRGLGYAVRATSYSGDDGIDLFVLDGDGDSEIGVQVKRWKGAVKVSQIREFAGSMVLNGLTRGVFVTTSRFQSGVEDTAVRLGERGLGVEVWDAERFYDRLSLTRDIFRPRLDDPYAPFFDFWHGRREGVLVGRVLQNIEGGWEGGWGFPPEDDP